MTAKNVNWSVEAVALLTEKYAGGEGASVAELAKELGKSEQAVRGKLVNLGVYKTQEKRAVGGASSVRKTQLVKVLAEKLGVTAAELESLEAAKKETLQLLIEKLTVTE